MLALQDEKKRLTNPVYHPSPGLLRHVEPQYSALATHLWLTCFCLSGFTFRPSSKPQAIVVWMKLFGQSSSYLHFHDEVDELLVFLKDKHDMMAEEVVRQQVCVWSWWQSISCPAWRCVISCRFPTCGLN